MFGLGMQEDPSFQPSLFCLYQAENCLSRKDANLIKKNLKNANYVCFISKWKKYIYRNVLFKMSYGIS